MDHGTHRRLARLLLTTLIAIAALPIVAWAKTGSYTIDRQGGCPDGRLIRVTAKAEDGTTYDQTFNIGGQTSEQARNSILSDMQAAGWNATTNGTNGIDVTSHGSGSGKSSIKEVDIGDDHNLLNTDCDGNVTIAEAKPGDKNFKFACALPNADGTTPGTLKVDLNATTVSAALVAGDTPTQAATKLETALTTAGYVVNRAGAEVTLDWENATNHTLLGNSAHVVLRNDGGAGGPHVRITVPDLRYPPLPGVSPVVLIGMLIALALGGTLVLRQRRTA